LTLVSATVLFWVLVAIPVRYLLGGEWTYLYSGTAMLLCLVPGVLTMLWAIRAGQSDPQQQLLMVLGGTGVRLFGVLTVAYLLWQNVAVFHEEGGFLLWLVVFYMVTLAVELQLVLSSRAKMDSSATL
jgi:hypothetical protein